MIRKLDFVFMIDHVFSGSRFIGSRFLWVQVFQGPGFSESRFSRVQVFLGPGFLGSGSRVRVQVVEVDQSKVNI